MIQGFDPRTAEPVGEPVADTETALGGERLIGEVARTTTQLRMFAGVLRNGSYEDAVVTHAEGVIPDLRRINRPVGPAGVFGLVHGVQAGLRLLRHPDIAAAGFTGSTAGGLALARICAERPVPIPFYGELGSVNPCVVLPGAAFVRPAEVATGYAGSLTLGAGQFCTNPGLLFVPEDVGMLSAIGEAVGASAGGPMLSGRIFAGYEDAVTEAQDHPGVTELAAGQPGAGPWGATPRVFQVALKEFAA